MQRPEEHITDTQADALFRSVLAEWAINRSDSDYGRDYTVEVFRNRQSTGVLFNAQLKGSWHTEYSADRSFISQELKIDSAEYLARQLEQPVFLFHADVEQQKLFWSAIQLDQQVLQKLDQGAKSLTVRIPTKNLLPDQLPQLLQDLAQAKHVLVARALLQTPHVEFAQAMRSHPVERMTEVADDLHQKGYRVDLDAAFRQGQRGDVIGAIIKTRRIATTAAVSGHLEIQFNAVVQAGNFEWLQLVQSEAPQAHATEQKLTIALELCAMTKKRESRHLSLFARITRKAAELDVAVQKASSVLMIRHAQEQRGDDPLWLAVLTFQAQQSVLSAHRKYVRALRLAQATARTRYRSITSRPLTDMALSITTLAALLEECGFEQCAPSYRASAFEVIQFSAAVATENRNMDELFNAVMKALVIETEKDGKVQQWIRSIIDGWVEESEYRKKAELLLERSRQRIDGGPFENEIETTHRQIHYNFLTSQGIDPTQEPWASLINLAIQDDDPTRVLIDCANKDMVPHPSGDPMLIRLGLERANPKILQCDRQRYALAGRTLDGINQEFNRRYCSTCPERSPRPADWAYYDEQQDKQ